MSKTTAELKDEFLSIYRENIKRDGADKLLGYLLSDASDFFTAPASTKFHGAYEGGLLEHSLNVYYCLKDYLSRERVKDVYGMDYSGESAALCALLHDICKVNVYHADGHKKDGSIFYTLRDELPYGHGEKSVYMISGYIRLSREEAFAIRYHMGFSGAEDKNNIGKAFEMFPLAFALSVADMEATFFVEGKNRLK